jgi:hypothetical protein
LLAIVIPYFKCDFFEDTLHSLASQTNKQFHVYIGDDASASSPQNLLERFEGQFFYTYYRFERNLGSKSLVQQWNRCLDLVQNETWLQILGDDDTMAANLVESFYENLEALENENCSVIRFASQVIDEFGNAISDVYQHPRLELSTDFLLRKFKGGTRSSLSEYIFKREKVNTVQFKDFPLAWYSDLLAVFEFADFKAIYTINNTVVAFRLSGKNITSKTDDLVVKNRATFSFYSYLLEVYGKQFSDELVQLIFDRLEKTHLDNKKYLKNWFVLFELYVEFFQINRFLLLILKIKKSIR